MSAQSNTAMDLAQVRARLAPHLERLKRLGVHALAVFGSFARGEQSPSSDIDFLVGLEQEAESFEVYRALIKLLEEATGREVDISTMNTLHPRMFRDYIRRDLCQIIGDPDEWNVEV